MTGIIDAIKQKVNEFIHPHENKEHGGTTTPAAAKAKEEAAPQASQEAGKAGVADTPAFKSEDVDIIFVLGGPGSGKGTQCAKLVEKFGFSHLSAGDLLRAEQNREGSEYGDLIRTHIREGQIVPSYVTLKLLENAIRDVLAQKGGKAQFLIDGFPRQMDQALAFDSTVVKSQFVLFLTCPESVMQERLLERGKTSGRDDDNIESIKKRFQTFINTSMPVVDYYREKDKVVEVDTTPSADAIHAQLREIITTRLPKA